MRNRQRTIACIGWESDSPRLAGLAAHFGVTADLLFVPRLERESSARSMRLVRLAHVMYRYVRQGMATVWILSKSRPHVVVVQNPPIVLPLLAAAYSLFPGRSFVIDSHTGAFTAWGWSLSLHRWLSARAAVTLVHNEGTASLVEDWDAVTLVLGFTEHSYPEPVRPDCFEDARQSIAVVCRHGAGDEPLLEIFSAAQQLSDVNFYISGDEARIPIDVLEQCPENCHFTGFLPYGEFIGLLSLSDAVMSLTTRDDTIQSGGIEAVSLGRALITSDSVALRDLFSMGAVFVDNTASGIAAGVREALTNTEALRNDASARYQQLVRGFGMTITEFEHLTGVTAND